MRHRKKRGRLGRRTSWRRATLRSLTNDLFTHQRIETTMAKAKALQGFAEPLITIAKKDPGSVSARRRIFRKLCDKDVVKSLFDELAPLYKDIAGGYTRIMPSGTRKGDGAQLAIMELTKRTISDEDLLGITREKELAKKKKKEKEKAEGKPEGKEEHAAPGIEPDEKEERAIEEAKKEKAKTEQKKVEKKGERRGFFRRFQRKSFGPSQ